MKTKKRKMYFIPMDVDIGSNKNALKPTITSNIRKIFCAICAFTASKLSYNNRHVDKIIQFELFSDYQVR